VLTPDELLTVAKRRGIVVWDRSQKVEMLFKGHKGAKNICAVNIITGIVHPIYPRPHFCCREVMATEKVRLGQLL